MADPTGSSARTAAPRRSPAPFVAYIIVQGGLIGLVAAVGGRFSSAVNLLVETVAAVGLGYGVIRYRPQPRAAWRFLAVGIGLLNLAGYALGVLGRLNPDQTIQAGAPTTLAAVGQLSVVIGLTLLTRGLVRRGSADFLDAVMTALAVYVCLWVLFIQPALGTDAFPVATAVTLPIGSLLVFTTTVWLVLGGGLRDPAIALVVLGAASLALIFGLLIVLALRFGSLRVYGELGALGSIYFAAFGAAGVHPALDRPRPRAPSGTDVTGPLRIALFVALSLVLALSAATLVVQQTPVANSSVLLVPVAISGCFLLLLVLRLALAIRVAQRRADELARRTAALARSLAEQEELQRQLAFRAQHDPLTGLANRTVLAEAMRAVDGARRSRPDQSQALLLLDLDQFKDINDTLGHPVGDQLLVDVAQRLRELTPPRGTLTRLGGDEFAVFVEPADEQQALELAETLRTNLSRVYDVGGRELFITTSIGVLVTANRTTFTNPSDLLRDADLALYAAKSGGKDRVTLFRPELRLARLDHARISSGLRRALSGDEFVVHYQPIVEIETAAVVAVEALLRWQLPGGRLRPPNEFIPVAEDTGQIGLIGAWVLQRSLRDVQPWYAAHGIAVSVNVSGRQLGDPDFVQSVLDGLHRYDLPGQALIIEITESSLIESSPTVARAHLQRLRDHGVRIAIDDFGTGYSSLSYVARLPVDLVKIDKSFTQTLGTAEAGSQDWAFTRAILRLVASLDKRAVAEGVETAEQAEALRLLRCPLVQGFYYSRPVPAGEIDRALPLSRPTPSPSPTPPRVLGTINAT